MNFCRYKNLRKDVYGDYSLVAFEGNKNSFSRWVDELLYPARKELVNHET